MGRRGRRARYWADRAGRALSADPAYAVCRCRPMRIGVLMSLVGPSTIMAQAARKAKPQPRSGTRIEVGPNIRVSNDGSVPHIESILAADPTDARVLIGAVTVQ